jgi:hypothetical protein
MAKVLTVDGVKDVEKTLKEKPNDNRKSYATPTIIEHNGQKQLISPAAEATFSYDPQTGKELWRVRHQGWGWNVACRPIYDNGLVFLTTGVAKILLAVDPSGSGDVTNSHVVWSNRRGSPEIPSPLIVNDLIFFTNEGGVVSCLEAKTGNQIWKGRIGGNHWASPVYADEKIYFFNQEGDIAVVSASREFQLLADNVLNASFIASPAIVGNAIILRSTSHLYHLANGFERTVPKDEAKVVSKKQRKENGKGEGKERGKHSSSKGSVQAEAKGWIDWAENASDEERRAALDSDKFRNLSPEVQKAIKEGIDD